MKRIILFFVAVLLIPGIAGAQYELVWQEEFDGTELNTDQWTVENNVGIWNTGANQELQHYRSENVEVGPDGEGGNALILTAKRENYNGYQFTSGKIQSAGKVAAQYGKIEARIKLPVLENGLWPAFWMLGTGGGTWPANGEIDILEAGHADGINANPPAQEYMFNGALHWEHEGNYASYANHSDQVMESLYEYNKFTLVWTPTRIEMFFNDDTEPYYAMNIDGEDAEEFRDWPHYFILNLAVGGSFPGITDPNAITAPMPAQMFVDYIRVYQRDEDGGQMVVTPPISPVADVYGVFTENPEITEKFVIDDMTNSMQVWENTLQPLEEAPSYEGSEVMAFYAPPAKTWYGLGHNTASSIDLSHFQTGYLHFSMRTTFDQDFWVGVGDTDGNEGRVNFTNGNEPYGFARDGHWHTVSVPVSDLTEQGLNLSSVGNIFMFGGDGATTDILVDDVYYSLSATPETNSGLNANRNDALELPDFSITSEYYGVFTENPNVPNKFLIDDVNGVIYVWENTLSSIPATPYDGEEVLSYSSTGAGWWGFGVTDEIGHDLTHYANGMFSFSVKTTSQKDFHADVYGANGTQATIAFNGGTDDTAGSDPDGFVRDGEWHRISVPVSDLTAQGLDLSAVGIPFSAGGGAIASIAFDDVIFTEGTTQPENTNLYTGGDLPDPIENDLWDSWFGDGGQGITTFKEEYLAEISITNAGWAAHSVQFFQDDMSLPDGDYTLTFKARADDPRPLNVNLGKGLDVAPWFIEFMDTPVRFNLTDQWQTFTLNITKENVENVGKLVFELGFFEGENNLATTVYIDDVSLVLSTGTSIGNQTSVVSTSVYPNPASTHFFIDVDENIDLTEIFNLSGKLIFSDSLPQSGSYKVDCATWDSGYYFIKATGTDGEVYVSKVFVNP